MSYYRTVFYHIQYTIVIVLLQDNIANGRIIDGTKNNLTGEKIKQYRKERKMSQQQLSAKLETLAVYICRGSISRIEDGSRTVTDIELYGLSQILQVPIEKFFEN